jgi:hypothetical protein
LQRHLKTNVMPKKATIDAAKRDKAQGKSANTQAGEFVKEERQARTAAQQRTPAGRSASAGKAAKVRSAKNSGQM